LIDKAINSFINQCEKFTSFVKKTKEQVIEMASNDSTMESIFELVSNEQGITQKEQIKSLTAQFSLKDYQSILFEILPNYTLFQFLLDRTDLTDEEALSELDCYHQLQPPI
jgi:trehalose-6-phosphatase